MPRKKNHRRVVDRGSQPQIRAKKRKSTGDNRAREAGLPPHDDHYDSADDYVHFEGKRHPGEYEDYPEERIRKPPRIRSKGFGKDPEKRQPINAGTIIALVGFVILIIGILLPMYHLTFAADIQTRTPTIDVDGVVTGNEEVMNYTTDGAEKLLIIDGKTGIELNIPTEDGEIERVFKTTFPYGYIYVGLLIITIVLGIFAKTPIKRGRKYIVSGFLALIPIFIILIMVSQLGTIVGEDRIEPPLDSFIDMLSAGPVGGALPLEIDYDYDSEVLPPASVPGYSSEPVKVTSSAKFHTSITWGLSLGGYMILIGSIIVIAGGSIDIYLSRIKAMRLSAYREAMFRTYEDLHLSPDEANIMIGLRDNLKISEKEHMFIKDEVMEKIDNNR